MSAAQATARLSLFAAARVVARRDFTAILFSRAFLFFLLGPLFPLVVGVLAGGIGGQVEREAGRSSVALAMAAADSAAMAAAARTLDERLDIGFPPLRAVAPERPEAILARPGAPYSLVVSGSLAAPVLTGPASAIEALDGPIALLAAEASGNATIAAPPVALRPLAVTAAGERRDRIRTAQAAQLLLFLLMMLLAGMVLSNLVEEKANKVIEVLAAAIPMDAVFLGKLFAMLAVSFVGIVVWGGVFGLFTLATGGVLPDLPAPAVGWPLFLVLAVAYFAMGYLLLGSLFLTIGGMAATVREVQTLSMPVTMMQLLVFFLAAYALGMPGSWLEMAAAVFPLSSPFAMLARAALSEALWPHALALAWQGLCVVVIVRLGAGLFRRRVMKAGPSRRALRGS